MSIDEINRRFAIDDRLTFERAAGGLVLAQIDTEQAVATVSLHGGQVLSYRPRAEEIDLLFVSGAARFNAGHAIRGGIPVCWPWFGPDPELRGRPNHGLVRTRTWTVRTTAAMQDGRIRLVLGLDADVETAALWPHKVDLAIEVVIGRSLGVTLISDNTGDQAVRISQALHTYLRIGDIAGVRILGLEGACYVDKVDGNRERQQAGPLVVEREVDRIYRTGGQALWVHDDALGRRIRVTSSGSRSAVIWNPWAAKAAAMEDLDDADYTQMLCVETANADADTISLQAGDRHRLGAAYRMERL